MKKLIFAFLCSIVIFTNAQAQEGMPAKQRFVCRTNTSFEQILVQSNNIGEVLELSYQSPKDKKFVKLKILKNDKETMRIIAQRPDTKQQLIFSNDFIMSGSLYLADGSVKEFMPEYILQANTGEQMTTSGGPVLLPYFYKSNQKGATFIELIVPQEQLGNSQTLPTGENYYEVTIPNKKGKYKIASVNGEKQKIKLVAPDGKITVFDEK
ncbi:MAG: hypothetical protein EAZ44_05685 [Cytophagia bacterium]|nr:MAG: hypothetical protein EAZ44_05685 [Cytophagia bacterium]